MTALRSPLLLTLGYGKRSIGETIELLKQHEIGLLVDVRSAPWSRYHPNFSHDALERYLATHSVAYLFLGRELGGRPSDPTCYDEKGSVDYEVCRQRPAFQAGIRRLRAAWEQGSRLALLCSESRPEDCHRSKMLGVALAEVGVEVIHLDEDGAQLSQREVMQRLSGRQPSLFGDLPPAKAVRSRRQYRSESE